MGSFGIYIKFIKASAPHFGLKSLEFNFDFSLDKI